MKRNLNPKTEAIRLLPRIHIAFISICDWIFGLRHTNLGFLDCVFVFLTTVICESFSVSFVKEVVKDLFVESVLVESPLPPFHWFVTPPPPSFPGGHRLFFPRSLTSSARSPLSGVSKLINLDNCRDIWRWKICGNAAAELFFRSLHGFQGGESNTFHPPVGHHRVLCEYYIYKKETNT